MEWFSSKTGCIYEPSYDEGSQSKGCCVPPGKTLPPCAPIISVATRTKCVAVRLVLTLFLLILMLASIYRASAWNVPRFSLLGRPQIVSANICLDVTSNPSGNPSGNPSSKSPTEDVTDEAPANLETTD
ncbi:hypothetical protein KPH14_007406 [Odynerus spinipes]|uniref:Uncharacterized protein n=1 Tax=Odynerus spinipes TaxID=1348599 RepID=A0AAD9RAI1_9HYME|nr:hypothetical protein KPH14_007406 [Odynerus spinipes]